jgi:hypothetical protein
VEESLCEWVPLRGADRHNWRPKEELYDIEKDPFEMDNLA